MPPKKYLDFAESTPYRRIAKQHAKDEQDVRSYVTITCPHCAVAFVEIAADRLPTNKASECKKHLLQCEAACDAGVCAEPVKRKREVAGAEPAAHSRRVGDRQHSCGCVDEPGNLQL